MLALQKTLINEKKHKIKNRELKIIILIKRNACQYTPISLVYKVPLYKIMLAVTLDASSNSFSSLETNGKHFFIAYTEQEEKNSRRAVFKFMLNRKILIKRKAIFLYMMKNSLKK